MGSRSRSVAVGLVVVGSLWVLLAGTPPRMEAVTGLVDGSRAWMILPPDRTPPFPLVVVLAGAHVSGHMLDDPATDLANAGFAVGSLDLYDCPRPAQGLRGLVAALAADPRIDARRIAIFAHSWSVTPAMEVAHDAVRAVIAMGYDPTQRRGSPPVPNLLLVFGVYDDYIGEREMGAALAGGSPGLAVSDRPGQATGDFALGTARKLFISPCSNHGGEPFDPQVMQVTREWLGQALSLREPLPCPRPSASWRHLATVVLLCLVAAWARPWLELRAFMVDPRARARILMAGVLLLSALVVTGWVAALEGICAILALVAMAASCEASHPLGPLLAWHGGALTVAVEGMALLSHLGSGRAGSLLEWGAFMGLMQVRYAPSMAGGVMHAWREQSSWPLLLLLASTWALALLVGGSPGVPAAWLTRWTATLRGTGGFAVMGVASAMTIMGAWAGGSSTPRSAALGVLGLLAGAAYVAIARRAPTPPGR